jgi:hypothetical protein
MNGLSDRTHHQQHDSKRTAPERLTYTLNAAAHASGLSCSTLYRHAAAGRLRLIRVQGRTLVDAASLRALLGVPT